MVSSTPPLPPGASLQPAPGLKLASSALGFLGYGVPDAASLEAALKALAHGESTLKELAVRLGFKPPLPDTMAAQVITGWLDSATGQVFIAPSAGWQSPSATWRPALRVNPEWVAPYLSAKPVPGKPDPALASPDPAVPPPKPLPPAGEREGPNEHEAPEQEGEDSVSGPPDHPPPPADPAWSLARDLTDAEWLGLRKALAAVHDGREAVAELANALGFKPPVEGAGAASVLLGWLNESTGAMFVAPLGWSPTDGQWGVIAKLPLDATRPPPPPSDDTDSSDGTTHPVDDDGAPDGVLIDPIRDGNPDHDGLPKDPRPADPPADLSPGLSKGLVTVFDSIRMIGHALRAGEPVEARLDLVQDPVSSGASTRIEYEWRVGDKVIEGATGLKLPAMPLLAGREISLKMSVVDSAGAPEVVTSILGGDETAKLVAGRLMRWARQAADAPDRDGSAEPDVDANPDAAVAELREMSATDRFEVEGIDFQRYAVRASAPVTSGESAAVNVADVLATLKLAHGRGLKASTGGDAQAGTSVVDPFQLIAADVDGNGVVDRADAQALLEAVVHRGQEGSRERWLFVPEGANLAEVSRSRVTWNEPAEGVADGSGGGAPQNWIGVMVGDIDGSWKPDLTAVAY